MMLIIIIIIIIRCVYWVNLNRWTEKKYLLWEKSLVIAKKGFGRIRENKSMSGQKRSFKTPETNLRTKVIWINVYKHPGHMY